MLSEFTVLEGYKGLKKSPIWHANFHFQGATTPEPQTQTKQHSRKKIVVIFKRCNFVLFSKLSSREAEFWWVSDANC